MSVILKSLFGLFAIFCFVQCIEMARLARETTPENGPNQLGDALQQIMDKLKGALEDDSVKNFVNTASKSFNDGTKTLQEQFSDLTQKVSAAIQNANAQPQGA